MSTEANDARAKKPGSGGGREGRAALALVVALIQDLEDQSILPADSGERIAQRAADKAKHPGMKAFLLRKGRGGENADPATGE